MYFSRFLSFDRSCSKQRWMCISWSNLGGTSPRLGGAGAIQLFFQNPSESYKQ